MRQITDLNELKSIELSIMKSVHDFCEEKNITYVLAAGTLLGAIRHNGFIPWDDDIDIYVDRKNYYRIEKEFPEWGRKRHYYIAGPHSKKHFFPRDMIKICDGNTVLLETSYKREEPIGVFIDVWPLDEIPSDSIITRAWRARVRLLRNINLASDINQETASKSKSLYLAYKIFHKTNSAFWVRKMEVEAQKYAGKGGGKLISFQGYNNTYSASDFKSRELHEFEDTQFYIPSGYDGVLKDRYGDYMKLPPIEQQKPHHVQNVWYKD